TATGVTVTDTLPAGATFISSTPSQGSCSGTSTVTCTLGSIGSGGSATIQISVMAAAIPTTLNNTATVTAIGDANPANDSSTASTAISAAIPTMSEWALALLALTFVGISVLRMRS